MILLQEPFWITPVQLEMKRLFYLN